MKENQSTIQIFCRVRPLKKNSKLQYSQGRYWISKEDEGARIGFHIPKDQLQGLINHSRENFEFKFNHLFDTDTNQEEVFDIVAKPVISSALQGYNGTIFAYGQTGSGKTFTITGGAERYADRGLIPRTLQHIFKEIQKDPESQYTVHVSYLEIYNELGYDLLDSSRDAKKLEDLPKVTLQEDSSEYTHLRNLSVNQVQCEEDALNLLFVGDTNRMIAETPSNPSSSRSHCIFIVSLTCRKHGSDVIRKSKLHLVDLAGSERVARTGIDGNLLKEAKHINLSLHYLEQVIIALHEAEKGKRAHIPYRNSMMTAVLRDSLGGNCKTTMIATVAVEDMLIDESISTCRFAQRVALISNHATLNEEVDPQLMISRLKQEISRLKAEISVARGDSDSYPDGLPDYEKERIKQAVHGYIHDKSSDSELVFSDYTKIQYAFLIMKEWILLGSPQTTTSEPEGDINSLGLGLNKTQAMQFEKLKKLAEHRDNEINILVSMIAQLKEKLSSKQIDQKDEPASSIAILDRKPIPFTHQQSTNMQPNKQQLTVDKAKAFEIFKRSYPASELIDNQKVTLKNRYGQAKSLGEVAHQLRNQMKDIKEEIAKPDCPNHNELRNRLPDLVSKYKQSYQSLKELKLEIEHLQHLLEQGRVRMTRDFESWFINVYQNTNEKQEQPLINSIQERISQEKMKTEEKFAEFKPHSPPFAVSTLNEPQHDAKLAWQGKRGHGFSPKTQVVSDEATSVYVQSVVSRSSSATSMIAPDKYHPQALSNQDSSSTLLNRDNSFYSQARPKTEIAKDSLRTLLSPRPTSSLSNVSVKNVKADIQAFYKARQEIMNQFSSE